MYSRLKFFRPAINTLGRVGKGYLAFGTTTTLVGAGMGATVATLATGGLGFGKMIIENVNFEVTKNDVAYAAEIFHFCIKTGVLVGAAPFIYPANILVEIKENYDRHKSSSTFRRSR